MDHPFYFHKNRIYAGFILFIRTGGQLSDQEILNALGLSDYLPVPCGSATNDPHVYMAEDSEWLHVADDPCYSLWNTGHGGLYDIVVSRLPDFEIFFAWIGDIDWSFGFAHCFRTQCLRRFEVEDPHNDITKRIVSVDTGHPLPGELPLWETGDEPLSYLMHVASTLGIQTSQTPRNIRCYKGQSRTCAPFSLEHNIHNLS